MAEEPSIQPRLYRRLSGRGRRTGGCVSIGAPISTIWLADDHLLLRESIYGLSESYKRFYFRDVQAIVIRRSPRWIAWIVAWTLLCLLFFFCAINTGWRIWAWPFFSALCFILTMVQLARGPTCVTHLVTAVQRELLGSLNTLRKARRAFKTLVPLIEEKQGKLDLETLAVSRALPGQPSNAAAPVVQSTGVIARRGCCPARGHHHFVCGCTGRAGQAADKEGGGLSHLDDHDWLHRRVVHHLHGLLVDERIPAERQAGRRATSSSAVFRSIGERAPADAWIRLRPVVLWRLFHRAWSGGNGHAPPPPPALTAASASSSRPAPE
jgi:hypothetical protein